MEGAYSLPKLKAMQILQIGLPYISNCLWTSNGQQMNQQWTTNGFLYHIDRSLEEHSLVTCVKIWSYKKLCLSLSILIIPIISLIRISNLLPYARGICRKRTSPICRTRNYFRFNPEFFFFWFWILNAVLITSSFFSCWRRLIITRDPKTGRERARCSGWVKVKAPRFYFDQNVFDFVNLILKCGQTLIFSHIALVDQTTSLRKKWKSHLIPTLCNLSKVCLTLVKSWKGTLIDIWSNTTLLTASNGYKRT